ncbi:MAG: hypothetical protein ACR2OE_16465 [Thermomicrobiales bacterium]
MSSQTTVFKLEADRIEETLKEQRQQLRANPADRVLELKIEAAEERVGMLRRDHKQHVTREQQREAAALAREQDARAELEATLMATYIAAAPGTTDAEATAALPDRLHRQRLAEQERLNGALALVRQRLGRL